MVNPRSPGPHISARPASRTREAGSRTCASPAARFELAGEWAAVVRAVHHSARRCTNAHIPVPVASSVLKTTFAGHGEAWHGPQVPSNPHIRDPPAQLCCCHDEQAALPGRDAAAGSADIQPHAWATTPIVRQVPVRPPTYRHQTARLQDLAPGSALAIFSGRQRALPAVRR
jgi:hypothetical protein